jgi:nucleoside 2-deoxyribosyltransferase
MKTVYLAGPDVFLRNAKEVFEEKKAICRKYGLEPLSPLDTELNDKINMDPTQEVAALIYKFDVMLMDKADGILANMEPFRGPSMDTGTSFEMGYCAARKIPIVGYSHDLREYMDKTEGYTHEDKFCMFEDYGLIDNLMIVQSVRSQGVEIVQDFEEAVKLMARFLEDR